MSTWTSCLHWLTLQVTFPYKGKMTAFKFTKRHARLIELFQLVDTDWDVPNELFSRTAQIRERGKMSMTCGTVSSAPRKEGLALTSFHHASALCASTEKELTTRLQSGAGVSRVIHRYPHQLDMSE